MRRSLSYNQWRKGQNTMNISRYSILRPSVIIFFLAVVLLGGIYAFEELGMQRIWCGHYDGNVKSRRVMEKLGFVYHHTTPGIELKLLGEVRTGHVLLLTKEQWEKAAF